MEYQCKCCSLQSLFAIPGPFHGNRGLMWVCHWLKYNFPCSVHTVCLTPILQLRSDCILLLKKWLILKSKGLLVWDGQAGLIISFWILFYCYEVQAIITVWLNFLFRLRVKCWAAWLPSPALHISSPGWLYGNLDSFRVLSELCYVRASGCPMGCSAIQNLHNTEDCCPKPEMVILSLCHCLGLLGGP